MVALMDPLAVLSLSSTLGSLLPSALLLGGLGALTLFLFWPRT
jgi:hypothetical protein